MKIFGLGLSRTGTTSLTTALNEMGYRAIHAPNDQTTKRELMNARYRLTCLQAHDAITDIPAAVFYPHFDELYPGAKFILTIRELSSWLESMKHHYERRPANHPWLKFMRAVTYGCCNYDTRRLKYAYQKHNSEVIEYFSGRADLLVIRICEGEGWDSLCRFLGQQVRYYTFPHDNQRQNMASSARCLPL